MATSTRLSSLERSSACSLDKPGHRGMDVSRAIARWASAGTPWLVSAIAVIAGLTPITAHAQADLFVIPFIGMKLAGHTNIPDPESPQQPAGAKKTTFGISAAIMGDGVLGLEGDFHHTPHFFERGIGGLISQSNVTTLTGNVVVAVPRALA